MNKIEIILENESREKEIVLENKVNEKEISLEVEKALILPQLEDLEVIPTKEQQTFQAENSYGYDKVIVEPIPEEYIIPKLQDKNITINENGTHNIRADEEYNGLNQVNVTVNAIENLTEELITYNNELTEQEATMENIIEGLKNKGVIPIKTTLQNKSITITENGTQTVTADSGYDGLSEVNVTVEVASSGGGGGKQPYMYKGKLFEATSKTINSYAHSSIPSDICRGVPNIVLVFWFARSECTISSNVTLLYQSQAIDSEGVLQTLYVGYAPYVEGEIYSLTQTESVRGGIGTIPLTNCDIPIVVDEFGKLGANSRLDFETDDSLNICLLTQVMGSSNQGKNFTTSSNLPILFDTRLGAFAFMDGGSQFIRWGSSSDNRVVQVRCPYKKVEV